MICLDDLRGLLDALPYPVFGKREDHRFIYGNSHFSEAMGTEDYIGRKDSDFFSDEQSEIFRREDEKVFLGQSSYNEERLGDTTVALTSKFPATLDDGTKALIGVVLSLDAALQPSDESATGGAQTAPVTHQRLHMLETLLLETVREKREALEQAMTDPATGVRNRNGLDHDLNQAMARHDQNGASFAVAFVDLDFFKRVNDRHGHDCGDQVLQVIASRLSAVESLYSVARLGGDEFAVVLDLVDARTASERQAVFDDIQNALSHPIALEDKRIHMTCSTGVALYPEHGKDIKQLKQFADAALLKSKALGRNRLTLFCAEIQSAADRRRLVEDGLHIAVADKSIAPHFQPILCSQTQRILGVEVLARWRHPRLGPVAPDEFIAVANDCGLLSRLDQVVFERGCEALRPMLLSGQIGQASFNVSAADITDPRFADDMLKRTRNAGLDPSHICIEIVETASIHDLDAAKINLDILHKAGVCIALDDFGTGFSNFRSLLDLPLDRIKIDRSLIRDMESNQAVFDLFLTIVNLAGILNVTMVAEGLETDFNALMVASAGVTHLQGFYFAKPMDYATLTAWMESRHIDTDVGQDLGGEMIETEAELKANVA